MKVSIWRFQQKNREKTSLKNQNKNRVGVNKSIVDEDYEKATKKIRAIKHKQDELATVVMVVKSF